MMENTKRIIYQLVYQNKKEESKTKIKLSTLFSYVSLTTNLSFCIQIKYLYNIYLV